MQQNVASSSAEIASLSSPLDIRLLVLDIDGTIAGKSNQISQTVQQAIRAAQNNGI